ncbi:MAG: sodium:solute symporter family protein [Nitrososphaerales archaeon]
MVEAWVISTSVIIGYAIACLIIGFITMRILKLTIDDFFVMGRTAGLLVLFLTTAATYHSAFAVLTSAATAVTHGVAWWVGSCGWTVCAGMVAIVMGPRYWHLGRKFGYITLADLLADFYESKLLRWIVAILMALWVIPYITVQAIGFGLITTIASEGRIPYIWASLLLTIVTVIYCVMGGQRATAWTDVIQGIWMYALVWIVSLVVVFNAIGGPGPLFEEVLKVKPELLSVPMTGWSAPGAILSNYLLFSIGLMLTMQHLQMKFYAARDPPTIRKSQFLTTLYLCTIYVPPVLTGLTGFLLIQRKIIPPLADITKTYGTVDAMLPLITFMYAPALLAGLLFAGAIAAAMSTQDNFFIATSTVITNDMLRKGVNIKLSEKGWVNIGRVIMIIFAFIAWYWAVVRPGYIFDLVALATAGCLQFAPASLVVIYPHKRVLITKWGAIIGIIVGTLILVLGYLKIITLPVFGAFGTLHAGVWGFIFNIIVALIVSLFTKPPSKETITRIYGYLEEALYGKSSTT